MTIYSMYLVRSCNTGFAAMWIAAWLSQYNSSGLEWLTFKSFNNWSNQTNSHVVAMEWYFASAELLETVPWIFRPPWY